MSVRPLVAPDIVWSNNVRIDNVRAGLQVLSRLLQDTALSAEEGEGVSSLCELLADELGRAQDAMDRATRLND